ncbi:MAG TPA: GerMN domain-containing protein [Acidobacteriaceae bacterium]|jgi:hypothetical protein|nr:GerMN domain-containing protein [Acidobacteriaceae bacterium]
MIPRYQRILFWSLSGAILLMALVLLHGCEQAREKLTRHRDETPLAAPLAASSETVHLALANDATGSITLVDRQVALPAETTARARVLLTRLIAEYSYKDSAHPLQSGPAVDDVFLLDLPLTPRVAPGAKPAENGKTEAEQPDQSVVAGWSSPDGPPSNASQNPGPRIPGGKLAVINLHGSFADQHPSGIGPETLTIDSILQTLGANFPQIEQVRFLVDGQPRETLNGHADLMRTYQVSSTASNSAPPATQEER